MRTNKLGKTKSVAHCSFAILGFFLSSADIRAYAGAIADDTTKTSTFSCDKRVELMSFASQSWCTLTFANQIRNSCYAVVHSVPLAGKQCSWQGCARLSLVGKPATLNSSSVVEYGIKTSIPAGTTFETVPNGVLPKYPFPRHYLRAGDALTARRSCPSNPLNLPAGVLSEICGASDDVLKLNMYWSCLMSF